MCSSTQSQNWQVILFTWICKPKPLVHTGTSYSHAGTTHKSVKIFPNVYHPCGRRRCSETDTFEHRANERSSHLRELIYKQQEIQFMIAKATHRKQQSTYTVSSFVMTRHQDLLKCKDFINKHWSIIE